MTVTIQTLAGDQIKPYLEDLAKLRLTIFREYPYLYEGNMDYERRYLKRFVECSQSIMVVAKDEMNHIVGASTACPMKNEMDEVKNAFIQRNRDPNHYFYFCESVLLPEYRGIGIGKEFFIEREKQAKKISGIKYLTFCAVERTMPAPASYQNPTTLWKKQGFQKTPEITTEFEWKDIGAPKETKKVMSFWIKAL